MNVSFMGPKSHPHAYINVCSKRSFDRKWPGSDVVGSDFIIVSRLTGSAIWVPSGTKSFVSDAHDVERKESFSIVTVERGSVGDLYSFIEKVKAQRVQSY